MGDFVCAGYTHYKTRTNSIAKEFIKGKNKVYPEIRYISAQINVQPIKTDHYVES